MLYVGPEKLRSWDPHMHTHIGKYGREHGLLGTLVLALRKNENMMLDHLYLTHSSLKNRDEEKVRVQGKPLHENEVAHIELLTNLISSFNAASA